MALYHSLQLNWGLFLGRFWQKMTLSHTYFMYAMITNLEEKEPKAGEGHFIPASQARMEVIMQTFTTYSLDDDIKPLCMEYILKYINWFILGRNRIYLARLGQFAGGQCL